MKVWLIGLAVIGALVLATLYGINWYAMGKSAHRIVTLNIINLQQQIQLESFDANFEYDAVKLGNHWFDPAIEIYNPRLDLTVDGQAVQVSTPKLTLVSSINQLREYELLLPDTVTVEWPDKAPKTIRMKESGAILLRTTEPETAPIESYFFDEWQADLPRPMVLDLARGDAGRAETIQTGLLPKRQWMPLHFRFVAPLRAFLARIERAS